MQRKLLLPGFNDAHVHFLNGGFALASVDLRDAKSPEEMAARLRDYALKLPKGRWILHGNWIMKNGPAGHCRRGNDRFGDSGSSSIRESPRWPHGAGE